MPDAVSTKVLSNTSRKYVIQITNLSDGTGESGVTKVDKSGLTGLNGLEPSSLVVEYIKGTVTGMSVTLYCDHTTDVVIGQLQGDIDLDYRKQGGFQTYAAGDTGDILLTTAGHTAGDTYNLIIAFRKKD
jgi:hypothetical protein